MMCAKMQPLNRIGPHENRGDGTRVYSATELGNGGATGEPKREISVICFRLHCSDGGGEGIRIFPSEHWCMGLQERRPSMRLAILLTCILVTALPSAGGAVPGRLAYSCGECDDNASVLLPTTTSSSVNHMGNLKVLVVLARLKEDTVGNDLTCWKYWNDSLPDFADTLVTLDTEAVNFKEGSLNQYYWLMSSGQFYVYGDHYPETMVTLLDSSEYGDVNDMNEEIISRIAEDTSFDFTDFDVSPMDSILDRVIIVWRTDGEGIGSAGLGPFSCITWDSMTIEGSFGIHVPYAMNLPTTLGIISHEMYHHFTCGQSPNDCCNASGVGGHITEGTGAYGVTTGCGFRGMCMNAFERHSLCWLDVVTISSDTVGLVIPDVVDSAIAYRVYVGEDTVEASAEYFLIENRVAGATYYTAQTYPQRCSSPAGGGLLIWHVDQGGSYTGVSHKHADLECAYGLFAPDSARPDPFMGVDGLDTTFILIRPTYTRMCQAAKDLGTYADTKYYFKPYWNNAFTPYTNPNTNGYQLDGGVWKQVVNSGISITNIRSAGGGEIAVDIHFDTTDSTITDKTTWNKWVMLGRDLTVAEGCTLTISHGATVSFAPGADYGSSGVDEERAELVAYGDIIACGTESDSIVFRPAGVGREHAPAEDDWYGIRIERVDTVETILEYCDIGHGHVGVSYFSPGFPEGLDADLGYISDCWIHDNESGGVSYSAQWYDPECGLIQDCLIENNGNEDGGFGVYSSQPGLEILSNRIRYNKTRGIDLDMWGDGPVIEDNIISQRAGTEPFVRVRVCPPSPCIVNHPLCCIPENIRRNSRWRVMMSLPITNPSPHKPLEPPPPLWYNGGKQLL